MQLLRTSTACMAAAAAFCAGAVGAGFRAVGFAFDEEGIAEGDNAQAVGAGTFHLSDCSHRCFLQLRLLN